MKPAETLTDAPRPAYSLAMTIDALLPSWLIHLEAENLSPKTIKSYKASTDQLGAFLVERGMPADVRSIHREHLEGFIVALMERTSASTAATRFRGLQQFFRWLTDEGEIEASPMARMKPPKLEERPAPVVSVGDLSKLFATCQGRSFEDRRDAAILRLFLNAGARLAELTHFWIGDVDLARREILVRGKGRKTCSLPIGPKATKALDRYLRERARHSLADTGRVWLGLRGPMTDSGITQMLRRLVARRVSSAFTLINCVIHGRTCGSRVAAPNMI